MLNQTLLSGDLENLINFQETKSLNVYWAVLLVCAMVVVRINGLNQIILLKIETL